MTAKELIKELEAMLKLREDRDAEVHVDAGDTSYALVGVDLVEDLVEGPEPDVIVLFSSASSLA
jgi:hypothetical protein